MFMHEKPWLIPIFLNHPHFQIKVDESLVVISLDEFIEVGVVQTSYKCDVYNNQTKYKQNLTRHMKTKHSAPSASALAIQNNLPLMCQYCGNDYKSMIGGRTHVKDKHEIVYRFKCGVCGKGFSRLWNYKGNLTGHHKQLREKCQDCGKEFQYRSALVAHTKSCGQTKEGTSRYHCSVCNSYLQDNKSLKDHIRGAH